MTKNTVFAISLSTFVAGYTLGVISPQAPTQKQSPRKPVEPPKAQGGIGVPLKGDRLDLTPKLVPGSDLTGVRTRMALTKNTNQPTGDCETRNVSAYCPCEKVILDNYTVLPYIVDNNHIILERITNESKTLRVYLRNMQKDLLQKQTDGEVWTLEILFAGLCKQSNVQEQAKAQDQKQSGMVHIYQETGPPKSIWWASRRTQACDGKDIGTISNGRRDRAPLELHAGRQQTGESSAVRKQISTSSPARKVSVGNQGIHSVEGSSAGVDGIRKKEIWNVSAFCPCAICCESWASVPVSSGRRRTASGHVIRAGDRLIAAPPEIPFGTWITVPGYGRAQVLDRGGAIKGKRLDLYFPTHQEALNWGRQHIEVTF